MIIFSGEETTPQEMMIIPQELIKLRALKQAIANYDKQYGRPDACQECVTAYDAIIKALKDCP